MVCWALKHEMHQVFNMRPRFLPMKPSTPHRAQLAQPVCGPGYCRVLEAPRMNLQVVPTNTEAGKALQLFEW
jgi:hypothetical protein